MQQCASVCECVQVCVCVSLWGQLYKWVSFAVRHCALSLTHARDVRVG